MDEIMRQMTGEGIPERMRGTDLDNLSHRTSENSKNKDREADGGKKHVVEFSSQLSGEQTSGKNETTKGASMI